MSSKAQIWVLVIFGILFLLIGFVSGIFTYLGLLLIGAGLYLGLRPGGILRKEQVLEDWGTLIENAQGRSNEVFQDTENFIEESEAPSLETWRDEMASGIIGSFFGEKRDFLVVKAQQSSMLKPYQIFVGVRDYGNNLDVSWYLTYRLPFWRALLRFIPFIGGVSFALESLDLFDRQDLTAYTSVANIFTPSIHKKQFEQ